jgi:hypothetical protein
MESVRSTIEATTESIHDLKKRFNKMPDIDVDLEKGNPEDFPMLGEAKIIPPKKGKKFVLYNSFISGIQKEELFTQELGALEKRLKVCNQTIKLMAGTLDQAASTVSARLESSWKSSKAKGFAGTRDEFLLLEEAHIVQEEVRLPKLTSPINGIRLEYKSSVDIPVDTYARLSAIADRHVSDFLWYAPYEAIKEGKVQPLSQSALSYLMKNSNRKTKVSSLNKTEKELIAWRWLIISHNNVFPADRIALPPQLSLSYERKGRSRPAESQSKTASAVNPDLLAQTLKEFVATLKPSPPGLTYHENDIKDFLDTSDELIRQMAVGWCVRDSQGLWKAKDEANAFAGGLSTNLNSWFSMAKTLQEGRVEMPRQWVSEEELGDAAEKFSAGAQITDTLFMRGQPLFSGQRSSNSPPLKFGLEEEGECLVPQCTDHEQCAIDTDWEKSYLKDLGFEDVASYEEWQKDHPESIDLGSEVYYRNDIDLLDIKEGQTYLSVIHNGIEYHAVAGSSSGPIKSQKAKGKTPVLPVSKPVKEETKVKDPGEGPSKASVPLAKKSKKVAKDQKAKPDPLTTENPLRVKGEPKSKALSDQQRDTLRKFFKLENEQVPSDKWAAMTNKERSLAMKARSIPRWASDAVLRHPDNLEKIVKGELTSGNRQTTMQKAAPSGGPRSAQAMEAWQKLKGDFSGTVLFRIPHSAREKAFKRKFDQLVEDYGKQSCFPKLRERPEGSPGQRGRSRSSESGGLSGILDIAKAIGEISRAFSGR